MHLVLSDKMFGVCMSLLMTQFKNTVWEQLACSLQAEAEVMKAQVTQNTADIDRIKLAHLMLLPSKSAARLQHFPALAEARHSSSPPTETIIGQDEQLSGLLGLVADGNNKRNVVIITGAPGMVRRLLVPSTGQATCSLFLCCLLEKCYRLALYVAQLGVADDKITWLLLYLYVFSCLRHFVT